MFFYPCVRDEQRELKKEVEEFKHNRLYASVNTIVLSPDKQNLISVKYLSTNKRATCLRMMQLFYFLFTDYLNSPSR